MRAVLALAAFTCAAVLAHAADAPATAAKKPAAPAKAAVKPAPLPPERAIEQRVVVNAPVAEVYKTWTTGDGIKTFFAPEAIVQLRSNGLFEIHMNPYAPPGLRGADDMRVLAFQENKLLSFTWNAPPSLPEARQQRTVVILRFRPVSDGQTEVTLRHVGWGEGGEWDKAYDYFTKAWAGVFSSLKKRFETGPLDFTEWLKKMRELTDQANAKAAADAKAAAEKAAADKPAPDKK